MARIRTIKPEFPQSESMGNVSRESRLCFILLWTVADDSGRLRGNSRMLASLLYPYDDDAKKHIDTWLDQLEKEQCVVRYMVDGTSYIQVLNWGAHQKIDKPSQSKIPPFSESSRAFESIREGSGGDQDQDQDQGRDQGSRKGSVSSTPQSAAKPPAIQQGHQAVMSIPLVDKTEYEVDTKQLDEWRDAYPAVNVLQQLKEMRAWCSANPTNRKTRRGVNAFIVRWLGKEQDKGGARQPMKTFAQIDREDKARRWEEMTGERHPDANVSPHSFGGVIDITPASDAADLLLFDGSEP